MPLGSSVMTPTCSSTISAPLWRPRLSACFTAASDSGEKSTPTRIFLSCMGPPACILAQRRQRPHHHLGGRLLVLAAHGDHVGRVGDLVLEVDAGHVAQ